MARLPLEHTRSNHQRIQPSSTRRTSWCAALPWDVAKKARAMELALEDWLSTKNGEKQRAGSLLPSSTPSTPSTSMQNGSPNLEIRQQKAPAPPPGGTFSTTSPPKITVSLPPNPPASTAVRASSAVLPSPSPSPSASTTSSTSVPATSSAPSLKDGAPSSITFATNPAPTTTDESLLLNGGTSTFNGFNTATATGFPSGLVVASATATPTPSSAASAAKSTSQKLTPYLIAAGSVGGFVISIIVIYLVLRCRKRTKLGRPKSLERDPREPTPPPDFGDMMSYSGSKGGMDNDSYRSKSVSTASPQFSQGSPFAPPPLKVARSSFMGRERGDLVRATINRHPLATLDEHSFFRSDNNNNNNNISNASPTNDDHSGWNEKSNFSAPRRPSLAQQISNGANRDPVPPVPRANSAKNSPAHSVSPVVSIADEIGIGLGVLPLNPRPNNDPAVAPYTQTHSGTRRPSPPYMQTHSATRRPSPPGRRSSFKELSQLSFTSQPDNINPGAPPSSVRESVATNSSNTILDNRASVTTSVVSVPRFRSVNGWVDYQTNRFERKGSEPHDTPPAAPMVDGAEIGLASSDDTDDDALRMNSNTSSIVTVRPWNYAAHNNSPVGAGEAANERNPTTTPTRRSSWETEREPRTPHRPDDEDVFSDAMEHYPVTPTPLQPAQQPCVTPPRAAAAAVHPIFGYGDDGGSKPAAAAAAVSTTPPSRDNGRPTHPPLASTNNEIAPWHNQRDRAAAKATDMRRMDSTSTATVFRYHPGEEVKLGRTSRVESVVLDESMGVDRKVSSASRGLGGL